MSIFFRFSSKTRKFAPVGLSAKLTVLLKPTRIFLLRTGFSMTRCMNRNTFTVESGTPLFRRLRPHALIAGMLVLVPAGCRNTTNSPIGPISSATPLSPLSPVQGTAPLSPIQPTAGVSALGAPTRVPPPSTGSYSTPKSTYAAPSTYGPTSSWTQPSPSALSANGLAPGGATLGASGMTQGVTELNSLRSPTGVPGNPAVRQTGWMGDNSVARQSNVQTAQQAYADNPPANNPANEPGALMRAGGMQPIDLTQAPYPPGYVPPQQRPGATTLPQSIPYPQAARQASQSFTQSTPSGQSAPLGQPTNWTTDRSATASMQFGSGFRGAADLQTAGRISDGNLPSTEPYQGGGNGPESNDSLQWRRPSPRF